MDNIRACCSVISASSVNLAYSFCRLVSVAKTPSGRDAITFDDKSLRTEKMCGREKKHFLNLLEFLGQGITSLA